MCTVGKQRKWNTNEINELCERYCVTFKKLVSNNMGFKWPISKNLQGGVIRSAIRILSTPDSASFQHSLGGPLERSPQTTFDISAIDNTPHFFQAMLIILFLKELELLASLPITCLFSLTVKTILRFWSPDTSPSYLEPSTLHPYWRYHYPVTVFSIGWYRLLFRWAYVGIVGYL